MATFYSLAPSPKWYFVDRNGVPAAGGRIETFSSADHTLPKSVYSDAGGTDPYPSGKTGIPLDSTGGTPVPMYWETDDADPEVGLYYIRVLDGDGNLITSIDHFPIIGSGGSTPTNIYKDIENYVINGSFHFIDAVDTAESEVTPVSDGTHHIAPGSGFFKNTTGNYVETLNGSTAGWEFHKEGGVGDDDYFKFVTPAPNSGHPTHPNFNSSYFEYHTGLGGTSVTGLRLQYGIPGAASFADKLITISFDSHCNVEGLEAEVGVIQFFGTGGAPSAEVGTVEPLELPHDEWARRSVQITVPSVNGKDLGTHKNDLLYLVIQLPKNVEATFAISNIQLQIGAFSGSGADFIYPTYSQTQYEILINIMHKMMFQTGDTKLSSSATALSGWVVMTATANTLGKDGSGATFEGSRYKPLYVHWYETYPNSDCPVSGGRTGNADNDWDSGKTLRFPDYCSRVLGALGVGSTATTTITSFEGARTHSLTVPQLAPHSHTLGFNNASQFQPNDADSIYQPTGTDTEPSTSTVGEGEAFGIIQPTAYLHLHIKL